MEFTRITIDPKQMGGVPCIRHLRIPVATVVDMVADGVSANEILVAYPDLEAEDVREALRYAAEAVRERELPLSSAKAPPEDLNSRPGFFLRTFQVSRKSFALVRSSLFTLVVSGFVFFQYGVDSGSLRCPELANGYTFSRKLCEQIVSSLD